MCFAPITPIGCNSHSPHSAPIRDSIPVSYFLFQFLPSSTSSSQTFPFHIASLTSRYITLLAARTLPLFILQVQIKPSGQTDSCMVTRSNLKNLYWIVTQQVAHHTINGCNLRPGDLLRTGTISGKFLEDGDEVIFSSCCKGDGYNVGFGTCAGKIVPPRD
ncbi:hypothetical protein ERO13_D07G188750v2 [Gossypium hirsutum]|nr:hypothetical protein ERO13_D07G188750v2 [Gossypium hirsutum]